MNKSVKLSEICKISGRVGWKGYTVEDLKTSGPWVIGANDITANHTLDLSKAKHISREKYEESPEIMIELNDILIVKVGSTIGKIAIVHKDIGEACINPNTVLLKKCSINPFYLYYYLISSAGQAFIKNHSSASAQASLNQTDLKEMPVIIYDLKIQNQIANSLNAFNLKIEVNNKINAELEAMAKLIYDYWFVQFDFPFDFAQGKPDPNGKPYKSSGGKMVYNAALKREIPEGWEVKTINESVEKIIDHRGKTPKKLGGDWSNNKDDIIALSAKIVKNGYLIKLEDANRVSKELFDKWMPEKLRDGDVLLTSEAPAGEMFFILGKTDYCMSQRLFALRANPKVILPSLLYYEIAKGNAHFQIQGSLSGSTVFGIRQDVLRTINVLVPNTKVQTQFDDKVLPILKKIKILVQQNQKLSELRDWLLPMLMNGQVTVANEELGITNAELGNDLGMVAEDNGKYGEV